MVDYASGSIGGSIGAAPSLDPWSGNNSLHQSLGGMYQFGGLNRNMASYNTMFGADAQMYYSGMHNTHASQSYKSPDYALKDFGMSQYIKHKILGAPVAIGQEQANRDIAEKEQAGLFWAGLGFDTASFTASAGSGVAGLYAGGLAAGVATGGIGLVAGAAIDSAKETYMDNYRRTSEVTGITNRFINNDGTRGLGKKDNIEISKFLGEMAADDPLLDIKDTENIMKMASASGMLNSESTASGVKKKLKELTKTLKAVADITGSSDMRGLMGQLKKFNMLGIESVDAKKMIANMTYSADIAGFSRGTVENYNNSAMMASKSTGASIGTVVGNTSRDVADAGLIRQSSGMILSSVDDNTLMSAMSEVNRRAASFTKTRGVDSSQMIISAEAESRQTGRSIEGVIESYQNLSMKGLAKRVTGVGKNIENKDDREMYRRRMSSPKERALYISNRSDLSKIDAGSEKERMLADMARSMKKTHKSATSTISTYLPISEMGMNEHAAWVKLLEIESNPMMKNKMQLNRKSTELAKKNRGRQQVLARQAEKGNFGYKAMELQGHVWDAVRNFVGGHGNAADINDMALSKSSGGIYGEKAKDHRYGDYGLSGIDPDSLNLLGIDNRVSKSKTDSTYKKLEISDVGMRNDSIWDAFTSDTTGRERREQRARMKDLSYKEILDKDIKNAYKNTRGAKRERIDLAYGNIDLKGASNTEKLGAAMATVDGKVDIFFDEQTRQYKQRGMDPAWIYSDENKAKARHLGDDIKSGKAKKQVYKSGKSKGKSVYYDQDQESLKYRTLATLMNVSSKDGVFYDTKVEARKVIEKHLQRGGSLSDFNGGELEELNLAPEVAEAFIGVERDNSNSGTLKGRSDSLDIGRYREENSNYKALSDKMLKSLSSENLTEKQSRKATDLIDKLSGDSDNGVKINYTKVKRDLESYGIGEDDVSSIMGHFSGMVNEADDNIWGDKTSHLQKSFRGALAMKDKSMRFAIDRRKVTARDMLVSRSNMSKDDAKGLVDIYASSTKENMEKNATKFLKDHNVDLSFSQADNIINRESAKIQKEKDSSDLLRYTKSISENMEEVANHFKG